jgi:hypothetical protein
MSEKDCTLFNFYFLGAHCVESGVSCTDCYQILLLLIEIPAVPVGTKFSNSNLKILISHQGPKEKFLKKVQSFSGTLYLQLLLDKCDC